MAYFTKRLGQVQYAAFQAAGYPIGGGSTESANKMVVEVGLKGSGIHGRERMSIHWWPCELWRAPIAGVTCGRASPRDFELTLSSGAARDGDLARRCLPRHPPNLRRYPPRLRSCRP